MPALMPAVHRQALFTFETFFAECGEKEQKSGVWFLAEPRERTEFFMIVIIFLENGERKRSFLFDTW
jgi:hypothetical protein